MYNYFVFGLKNVNLIIMKDRLQTLLEEYYKKAREGKMPAKAPRPTYSSLHKIIKTKDQALRFMKNLKDAESE
jgi:hypothetical protein